jgi:RHS repeat-associated protein
MFISAFGGAQTQTGTPRFASFGGSSFDVINLGNLNVHLEFPVFSRPGRGVSFSYKLKYDSSIWSLAGTAPSQSWVPASNSGWSNQTDGLLGQISYSTSQTKCFDDLGWYWGQKTSNWRYTDGTGVHYFPGTSSMCGNDPASETSTDGSGYTLSASAGTVTLPSGITIAPPINVPVGNGSITDTNGNLVNASSTTFTDTLGTVALTIDSPSSVQKTYTFPGPLGSKMITVDYTQSWIKSAFGCTDGSGNTIGEYTATATVPLPTKITLPDSTFYSIAYEPTPGNSSYTTGRISSVSLPSGGKITFTYGGANCADGSVMSITRRVYKNKDDANSLEGTWTYTRTPATQTAPAYTTITDPANNQSVIDFQGIYEVRHRNYSGLYNPSNPTAGLIQTVETCYSGVANTAPSFPCLTTPVGTPIRAAGKRLEFPTGKNSETDTYYNTLGLVTEVDEFGFWTGATKPAPSRSTVTTYATLTGIADRPSEVKVTNGGSNGTTVGRTTYAYDEGGSGVHGNVTTVTRWASTTASVSEHFTYNANGLVASHQDNAGNSTSFAYGECNGAFLTSISMPLSLSRTQHWDCNGGVLLWTKDENLNQTTYQYTDANAWRVTELDAPDGGWTKYQYNLGTPLSWNVATTQNLNGTNTRVSTAYLDGLGRVKQQTVSDPDGTDITDITYDAFGRNSSVTNPYRGSSPPANTTTILAYDPMGRPLNTTAQDGSVSSVAYTEDTQTLTDAAGKKRTLQFDGLGRLTGVTEDPLGLNYGTAYQYDLLGNLTLVQQGGTHTRTFGYDWLSRMTSESTPEAGTLSYAYLNGSGGLCSGDPANLCKKMDARNKSITFSYDALGRLTQKTYSDSTPSVTFVYDDPSGTGRTLTNTKGRVVKQSSNGNDEYFSYDSVGRVLRDEQCVTVTATTCGIISAAYRVDGSLSTLQYPSTRAVSFGYNIAGQLTSVAMTSFNGTASAFSYQTAASYAPSGALSARTLGNGITESLSVNNLLQASGYTSTLIQSNQPNFPLVDRSINYTAGQNNGNIQNITDNLWNSKHASDNGRTQYFTYDALNRIASASEGPTLSVGRWNQTYTIDQFGNLNNMGHTKGTLPDLNASANSNNQLTGFSYDASGNMIGDGTHTYQYDADGRMQSVDTIGAVYIFDAMGRRVSKKVGSVTTIYFYVGATVISELRGSDYSDYIFAGSQRLAKSDTFEDRLHITGTNCSNCGSQYSLYQMPTSSTYAGYVIQSGDRLFFRQYQSAGAHGGMQVAFTNGTNTNWSANDTDGNNLNNDGAQQYWHYRNVDLSAYAGRTINKIYLVQESTTAAGAWHIYFNDMALVSADGTVRPIYTRQTSISLTMSGSAGVTGRTYNVEHLTGLGAQPTYTTNFIHADHLGSSRTVTSTNGYPTYQATLLPYGYDFEQQSALNNYKFTGQERDAETGFDHFLYRQLATQGRWTSPDPAGVAVVDPGNPQTWNRYAYVANQPASYVDPLGLEMTLVCMGSGSECLGGGTWGGSPTYYVDGVKVSAEFADHLLNHMGAGALCPSNDCRYLRVDNNNDVYRLEPAHYDNSTNKGTFTVNVNLTESRWTHIGTADTLVFDHDYQSCGDFRCYPNGIRIPDPGLYALKDRSDVILTLTSAGAGSAAVVFGHGARRWAAEEAAGIESAIAQQVEEFGFNSHSGWIKYGTDWIKYEYNAAYNKVGTYYKVARQLTRARP